MDCIRACTLINKIKTDLLEYVGTYTYDAGLVLPAISLDPPDNDHKTCGCEVIVPFIPRQTISRHSSNTEVFREYSFCIYVVMHDNNTETMANFENLVYFISKLSQQGSTVDYMPRNNTLTERPQARICLYFTSYD
jgi:hypothetical protein